MAADSTLPSALPTVTVLGRVELAVAYLERSLNFWTAAIGLQVLAERPNGADLGVDDRVLISLVVEPGVEPAPNRTGLFHVALLLPERSDLAAWLKTALRARVSIDGSADHFVSEAVYLTDPDGHGIEMYWDRPRSDWEGKVEEMTTDPLDVAGLITAAPPASAGPYLGLPAGTTIGHVHLRVAAIPAAIDFYRDVIGFDLVTTLGSQAAFFAVGGYHHHVGVNTWRSEGGVGPSANEAGLRLYSLVLPTEADRATVVSRVRDAGGIPVDHGDGWLVRDPSGIALLLMVATD